MDAALDRIAVVGMAGRFPGARTVAEFWDNLCRGVESLTRFGSEGAAAESRRFANHSRFVGAEGLLDDVDLFDAAFFGYSPREAEIMDPQHRLALECAWEALEAAGYAPATGPAPVGVFLSTSLSSYLVRNVLRHRELVDLVGGLSLLLHNDKDFAPTSISHKLDLTGPSMSVGTACSSSLVAVHLACQSLLAHECDAALAGGVAVQVPQRQGYIYQDDGIYSRDGRCRAFDDSASGTVGGSGAAIVVLKRLQDAQTDGDHVWAVIRGSAINNDGAGKVGYTAPSVDGQAAVIVEAQAVAGIAADTVGYVEAHGTGTALGDPVEVAALCQAFARAPSCRGSCALGSVKTNVGHLDAAAGVTGLIKVVLALNHGLIPPSLHFERPNAHIDFERSPFFVNTALRDWPAHDGPRRAGVSSFGIGGTNAHVVLEEAPSPLHRRAEPRSVQLLVLSARTPTALDAACERVADHVATNPDVELRDLALTLAAGRKPFHVRSAFVCRDPTELQAALRDRAGRGAASGSCTDGSPSIVFAFPGQGTQRAGMAAELYRDEPTFRAHADACAAILRRLGRSDVLAAAFGNSGDAERSLARTETAQPALFVVEYALARTLMDWGVRPAAVIGHSLGEVVAASVAGGLSLDDALQLVTARGRLMEQLPAGSMTAVAAPEGKVRGLLDGRLALAAANGPGQSVVSGPPDAVATLESRLAELGIGYRRIRVTRAFHSQLVEPVLDELEAVVRGLDPGPPQIPWVSNVTGDWIRPGEVVDSKYWVRQLRETVRFGDGLARVLELDRAVVVEVGPGATLTTLVAQAQPAAADQCLTCLPRPKPGVSESSEVAGCLGRLWVKGAAINWKRYHEDQDARRVPAPSYAFERRRFWIEAPDEANGTSRAVAGDGSGLAELSPAFDRRARELAASFAIRGVDSYPGLRVELDALCAALICRYLTAGGVELVPEQSYKLDAVAQTLQLLPQFRPFLEFMVSVLADDGLVQVEQHGFRVRDHAGRLPDPFRIAEDFVAGYPQFAGLVELLVHCGSSYQQALSTPGAALAALYPNGRGDLLERTLGRETAEHTQTRVAVKVLEELVANAAAGRRLRILEVGAGGGRLTWGLAAALEGREAEYLATDVGRLFAEHLRTEASRLGYDFVRTAVLDVARDPAAQGVPGPFDFVVGLDVVHAAPDVEVALRNLQGLLAPGGILGFVETTAVSDRWLSLIWGLSEGWWHGTDRIRGRIPLLRAEEWGALVRGLPFAATATVAVADTALVLCERGRPQTRPAAPVLNRLPERRADPADWLYVPTWRRAPSAGAVLPPRGRCLVLVREALGERLAAHLADAGLDVVRVYPGLRYERQDARRFVVVPDADEDFASLVADVASPGDGPLQVVHAWNVGDDRPRDLLEQLDTSQALGLHSLLALARAGASRAGLRVMVVSSGSQDVLGGELTRPDRATLLAAVKVLPREFQSISCTSVDIAVAPARSADEGWLLEQLALELGAEWTHAAVAYRGRSRWIPEYEPLAPPSEPTRLRLRAGGVYLVAGGLGGIGLALAGDLAPLPAKLVLTTRAPFPPRERWQNWLAERGPSDLTSSRIRRLLELERAGAEVLVLEADVASLEQMEVAVRRAVERFGRIDGVIHAAGVVDDAGVVKRRTREETVAAIDAKLRGPLVLDRVLRGQPLDFFLLNASIGSILYKLKYGEVGYVAGSDALVAYALYRAAREGDAVAVSWTDWRETGMWADAQMRLAGKYRAEMPSELGGDGATFLDYDLLQGLSTAEGIEIFRCALAQRVPHIVASTLDFRALLDAHAGFTTAAHRDVLDAVTLSRAADGPPEQRRDLEPLRTALERAVAEWWRTLLGVEDIGRGDSFFELGGDSLIALRFLSRARDELGVDYSIERLFEAPTLAGVANELESLRASPRKDVPDLDELVL